MVGLGTLKVTKDYFLGVYVNKMNNRVVCVAETDGQEMNIRSMFKSNNNLDEAIEMTITECLTGIKKELLNTEFARIHIEREYVNTCKMAIALCGLAGAIIDEESESECTGLSIKNVCGSFSPEYRAFEMGAYIYQNCGSVSKSFPRRFDRLGCIVEKF